MATKNRISRRYSKRDDVPSCSIHGRGTKFVVEQGPEVSTSAPAPPKKLEDIMKEISAASVNVIDVEAAPEARTDEGISSRSVDSDRIMESREM